jgi:hypothetical protein
MRESGAAEFAGAGDAVSDSPPGSPEPGSSSAVDSVAVAAVVTTGTIGTIAV